MEEIADFDPNELCSKQKVQVSMNIREHWLKVRLDELARD